MRSGEPEPLRASGLGPDRRGRTAPNSPWTNGKIERFWNTLQAEVLDREVFRSLADAEAVMGR